jgi:hypothetical protein
MAARMGDKAKPSVSEAAAGGFAVFVANFHWAVAQSSQGTATMLLACGL